MKLTIADPRYLRDSISVISELVNEVSIKFDKDGMEIIAMDPANVAMVVFRLLSSAFVEYDIKQDISFNVNLENFKQILSRHGSWELMEQDYNTYRGSRNLRDRSTKVKELLWILKKN